MRSKQPLRSVLITGTSTGIGRATAVVLASRGWRVFATMRNLEKRKLLEQTLEEADVQNGVEIEQLDVGSGTSIQAPVLMHLCRRVATAVIPASESSIAPCIISQ